MLRSAQFVLVAAVLAGFVAVPHARSQPPGFPGTRGTPSVHMYAALFLDNAELQKELKLTPDQVKKLEPVTKTGMTTVMEAINQPDANKQEETNKSLAKKLGDALKPEQMKRLKQIVYQQLEKVPVGSRVFAADAELAKHLTLTADQKQQLQNSTPLRLVLTDKQKKVWTELVGKEWDAPPGLFGVQRGLAVVSAPQVLPYLQEQSLATELKLTKDQTEKIAALIEKWQKAVPSPFLRNEDERKKAEELSQELTKSARALLTAAQVKRLDQVLLQQQVAGHPNEVYTLPQVMEGLKLTADQKKALKKIEHERRKRLLPLFVSGEEFAQIETAVKAHNLETGKQLNKVLAKEQQEQLAEMLGDPFKGSLRRGGLGGGFPSGRAVAPLFLVMRALLYADSPDLHKELNLSEEAVKKLRALQTKTMNERLPTREVKKLEEQAQVAEKELAKILKPEQMVRFKEVILQQHERLPARGGTMLGRLVEVQKGLKLTDDQKKKLQGGEALAKVLDEDQKKKLKEMLGKPFKGTLQGWSPFGRGPGRGRFVQLSVNLQLLEEKSVQEELQLSDEQKKSLVEQVKKYRDAYPPREGTRQDWTARLSKYNAEADRAVAKLLDQKQNTRLRQIALQQTDRAGRGYLLGTPIVEDKLMLSDKQKTTIAAINTEESQIRQLIYTELRRTRRELPEDDTQTLEALEKVTVKKLNESLTPAQKKALAELLGPEFKGKLEMNQRRGFPGIPF